MGGVYRPASRIAYAQRRQRVLGVPEPPIVAHQIAQAVTWSTVRISATFDAERPTATLATGRPSATWSKQ